MTSLSLSHYCLSVRTLSLFCMSDLSLLSFCLISLTYLSVLSLFLVCISELSLSCLFVYLYDLPLSDLSVSLISVSCLSACLSNHSRGYKLECSTDKMREILAKIGWLSLLQIRSKTLISS